MSQRKTWLDGTRSALGVALVASAALVTACAAPDPGVPGAEPSDVAASGTPTGVVPPSGGQGSDQGDTAGGGAALDAATTTDAGSTSADAGTRGDAGTAAADGGGAPPPPAPPPPPPAGAVVDCVDAINAYRATLGLAPYARWTQEESCADGQALSDSKTGKAHGAFTQCGEHAQDECPGWPGPADAMIPKCLAAMWAEGPGGGHYENMRGKYTQVACGFATLPNGSVWAVQDFR
jgi:hypothetical protein